MKNNLPSGMTLGSDPELKRFLVSWVDINATDCPCELTDTKTGETRSYGIEGDAWRLVDMAQPSPNVKGLDDPQKALETIFNNYPSDIEPYDP